MNVTNDVGKIVTIFSAIALVVLIIIGILLSYSYEKNIYSNWKLADKSSTIIEKSKYIDKFVESLPKTNLNGKHNAIFLKTPNNSFDKNFEALQSLQNRLKEIQNMDISSFEYQTAIQQITDQEQGEADEMLSTLKDIWWKDRAILLWDWVGILHTFFWAFMLIVGIGLSISEDSGDNYY